MSLSPEKPDQKEPEKPKAAFGVSTKRFSPLGLHPQLISFNDSNPLGPGQYNPEPFECCYKKKSASWKVKLQSEEFSKFLGFFNPELLRTRNFQRSLGGPGTYDLIDWKDTKGALKVDDVGFGRGERFRSVLKHDQPPPGSHDVKYQDKINFNTTPPFEWDGLQSRFKSNEPIYRQPPNLYNVPHKSLLDKVVSKRGPYDCFTGPRDYTTIKNKFAPPSFKPPDKFFVIPSEMDHLLHHPSKKRCGRFLLAERFPRGLQITATKKGFSMYMKNAMFPGPAYYTNTNPGGIKHEEETKYPFNSSNIHARPPQNWKIHPGPDRYKIKRPRCLKQQKQSWVFLSKESRTLVKVQSYTNFTF